MNDKVFKAVAPWFLRRKAEENIRLEARITENKRRMDEVGTRLQAINSTTGCTKPSEYIPR